MEVDEPSSQSSCSKPPESEKSEESPNKESNTPPKVAHVSLPLPLQFLRLGHEALGG